MHCLDAGDTRELTQAEISRVYSLNSDDRYAYSVNAIRDRRTLWCLRHDEGWCLGLDPDGAPVFPIWPHPGFARECATGDWSKYYVQSVSLEDFLTLAVDAITNDEYLLAVMPTDEVWVPVPFTHFKRHIQGPRKAHYLP